MTREKRNEAEEQEVIDETPTLETPTSNDVGKQTLTKAEMGGRDLTFGDTLGDPSGDAD